MRREVLKYALGGALLAGLVACGGGGGGDKPSAPVSATKLVYTDPTSGTFQLKKNTSLTTDRKLVLDVVATSAGTGAGLSFQVTADPSKVTWVKVADGDAEYVRNGSVFTLGSGVQAIKGKVSGGTLQAVVSQKGLSGSVALNGVLATVALELKSGVAPGNVSLSLASGKSGWLKSDGNVADPQIQVGTLVAQ